MPYRPPTIRRNVTVGALAILALGAAAPGASAHVTAQPPELEAGGFTRIVLRAPNERDVPTIKLAVQLPPELDSVRVQPVPGWTYKITRKKLDKPRELFGQKVTDYISQITWSGGRIRPAEFMEFPISMKLPERGTFGEYVFFPAIQTYAGGDVVRWIEKPETAEGNWDDLEEPAAHVKLTVPAGVETVATDNAADRTAAGTVTRQQLDDEVSSARTPGMIGLGLGIVALALAAFAVFRRPGVASRG